MIAFWGSMMKRCRIPAAKLVDIVPTTLKILSIESERKFDGENIWAVMMSVDFDFHIHTVFSDGSMSFEEVLTALRNAGLSKCGITDHFETGLPHSVAVSEAHYMDLFNRFKEKARKSGIEVLLGGETGWGLTA